MRAYMEGLIDRELLTPVERQPNTILGFEGSRVVVATEGNPEGARVSISLVQNAVDRIYDGEEFIFDRHNRSAFLGAVLETMDEVDVLTDPRRARLATGTARRNPDWEFDELILALDLYLRWRPKQPPAEHADLEALSDLLHRLPIHSADARGDDFRNSNGVRRKLGDFTAPDPDYNGAATKGGEGVHRVWDRFADDSDGLAAAVARITAAANGEVGPLPPAEDEEGCVEGRIVFRQHRVRERDPSLARMKKEQVKKQTGKLACEVCGLDFSERYGELGEGFMECHHTLPLGAAEERKTRLGDLAVVCSNCHRMIHRAEPTVSIEGLRERLQG
jgi:5-methylcytosine-specific restriction protein A